MLFKLLLARILVFALLLWRVIVDDLDPLLRLFAALGDILALAKGGVCDALLLWLACRAALRLVLMVELVRLVKSTDVLSV